MRAGRNGGAQVPAHRAGQPLEDIEEEKEMGNSQVLIRTYEQEDTAEPILQAANLQQFLTIAFDARRMQDAWKNMAESECIKSHSSKVLVVGDD